MKNIESALLGSDSERNGYHNRKKLRRNLQIVQKASLISLLATTHFQKANPIYSQIYSAVASQQKAISLVQFPGRQGLAVRGNTSEERNLPQLVRLSLGDSILVGWRLMNTRPQKSTTRY